MILRGVWFSLALYSGVIEVTSPIVVDLSTFGACYNSLLMVRNGLLFVPICVFVIGSNIVISSCLIPIIWLINKIWLIFQPDRPQIRLVRHSRFLDFNNFWRRLLSCSRLFWSDFSRFWNFCQVRDFFNQIVLVSDVCCQVCNFIDQILTLVYLCTDHERINSNVIWIHYDSLFQYYFVDWLSNLQVG